VFVDVTVTEPVRVDNAVNVQVTVFVMVFSPMSFV